MYTAAESHYNSKTRVRLWPRRFLDLIFSRELRQRGSLPARYPKDLGADNSAEEMRCQLILTLGG